MQVDHIKTINNRTSFFWMSTIIFIFTLVVVLMSEAYGFGIISTSFVKVLGKTLCLCMVALAMDLVWGYCGILSLGHFAFFGFFLLLCALYCFCNSCCTSCNSNCGRDLSRSTFCHYVHRQWHELFGHYCSNIFSTFPLSNMVSLYAYNW